MIFNDHEKLRDLHAFLGASQFHWINWSDEIFEKRFYSQYSTEIGTILHELASDCIKSKIRLNEVDSKLIDVTLIKNKIPRTAFNSQAILLNMLPFVNDSIGYRMESEVILYYSPYAFGTTDAISYDENERVLRISDYKSGSTPAHMEQLKIYAALFCLEYHKDPKKLKKIELRIYQNAEIAEEFPEAQEIEKFMEIIKYYSAKAQTLYERDK